MSAIWHVGGWNRNFGDWVLFDSIQYHLRKTSQKPLYFVPVDGQRTRFSKELISKMNREADMLLVGGGGFIFNRPEDSSVSGWVFNIALEDISLIDIPLVIYSIGYNKFPYDNSQFPQILNKHLKAVQDKAPLFSVRNTGTLLELEKRGLDPERIGVVMDAGAFAPQTPIEIPGINPERPVIGLNIAGDRPGHRFPEPVNYNKNKCYKTLAQALKQVVEREHAQILLLPHIVNMDELVFEFFQKIIGTNNIINLIDAMPFMYPPGPVYASFLVGAYASCNMTIGMRGHACIIPFGCQVPFLSFSAHNKNKFLLEDIGVSDKLISTEEIIKGKLLVADIANKIASTLYDKSATNHMKKQLEQKRKTFIEWNRKVIMQLDDNRRQP